MSLIYDALRQPATDAAVVRDTASRHAAPWRHALAGHRRPALWLLSGILVAGPLGYLLSRPGTVEAPVASANPGTEEAREPAIQDAPAFDRGDALARSPADDAPAVSAPAVATMPTTADAVPVQATLVASQVPNLSAPVASTSVAAPVAAAMPTDTATVTGPAPAPVAAVAASGSGMQTDVQVVASQIKVSVRNRDAANAHAPADDDADPAAVREAMTALNNAVGAHDDDARVAAIARLQALLPTGSLTLLRARAWAAHGGGDFAEAERLYHAILDRVPDDEHAGVNLALLDARRGDVDDARARLDRLAARNARSPQVLQAMAELDAARR